MIKQYHYGFITRKPVYRAYTMQENEVWIGFEILVDSTPVVADLVPRALSMLNGGARKFFQALQEV